jgi:uncharacterized protein (TIGR03435 family)
VFHRMAAVILLAFSAAVALCQPTAPSFEAASIRLNKSSKGGGDIEFLLGGERFAATNVPLSLLIATAYNVTIPQFAWRNSAFPVLSERFDIQAKAERPVSRTEMLGLLQSLLEDRFRLSVRRETKALDAYALVVDKGGPRLHVSDGVHMNGAAPLNPYHARGLEPSSGYLVFNDESMADLAWRLSALVALGNRVVVDRTGLNSHYNFELKFAPDSPNSDGPSIFTALREQLGLRLDGRKIPLEVLSVEYAERPQGN